MCEIPLLYDDLIVALQLHTDVYHVIRTGGHEPAKFLPKFWPIIRGRPVIMGSDDTYTVTYVEKVNISKISHMLYVFMNKYNFIYPDLKACFVRSSKYSMSLYFNLVI